MRASTRLSWGQGFTQLSSSLSSCSYPAQADISVSQAVPGVEMSDPPVIPVCPSTGPYPDLLRLNSVQGEPLPGSSISLSLEHSENRLERSEKYPPTPTFCLRRAPLPHPPAGEGAEQEIEGFPPFPSLLLQLW